MKKFSLALVLLLSFLYGSENEIIIKSVNALDRFMAIPEEQIPPKLLRKAKAIAIVPDMIRGGFVVAGRYGKGILTIRKKDGWSDPLFIKMYGASLGWQIGLESIDVILVFTNFKGVQKVLAENVTLGTDLSIAVGPVGRNAMAATDITLNAQIYSYSRSMGAFAGLALAGSQLQIDEEANMKFYNLSEFDPNKIIYGNHATNNSYVSILKQKLQQYEKW